MKSIVRKIGAILWVRPVRSIGRQHRLVTHISGAPYLQFVLFIYNREMA